MEAMQRPLEDRTQPVYYLDEYGVSLSRNSRRTISPFKEMHGKPSASKENQSHSLSSSSLDWLCLVRLSHLIECSRTKAEWQAKVPIRRRSHCRTKSMVEGEKEPKSMTVKICCNIIHSNSYNSYHFLTTVWNNVV